MNKFLIAASTAALLLLPSAAIAADAPTAEQCKAWLEKADVNKDGDIGNNEESKKYAEMLTKGGMEGMGEDTVIKGAVFTEACLKGTFGMPAM
jgi:hypothetical protein